LQRGQSVRIFDPIAQAKFRQRFPQPSVSFHDDPLDSLQGSSALVILSNLSGLAALSPADIHANLADPLVIDLRNLYAPSAMTGAGLRYLSVGRPSA